MSRLKIAWRKAAPYAVPALVFLAVLMAMFWRLWTPIDDARRAFGWDAQWEYWGDIQFQVDALRDGELPLWNPYDRGGYPFHGDPQTGLLYPPSWLLVLCAAIAGSTPWWVVAIKIIFHFWLAATGVFFFLRRRGNPTAACYAGGFLLILSYPYLHNTFSALNWNMAWAPWAMLAIDRWASAPSRGRAAWVALALGCCAMAGGPASFWYSLMVIVPYGTWAVVHHARRADDRRAYLREAAITTGIAGAIVLGMILAQFSSTSAVVGQSVRSARDLKFITTSTFGIDDVTAFVIPRFTGGNQYLGYATILWIGVLLVAFPTARRLTLAGIAVVGVLTALGSHADFLSMEASILPPFGFFRRAHRYLYVVQLPIAILGAEGLAALLTMEDDKLRQRIRGAILVVGAMGILIFGVGVVVKAEAHTKAQPLRDAFALACVAVLATTWVTYMILRRTGGWQRAFGAIAVVVLCVDLWHARYNDVEIRMHPVPAPKHDRVAADLEGVPLDARIYDRKWFGYRPGIRLGIRDFGGYQDDPLALDRYDMLLRKAERAPRYLGHANVRYLAETGDKKTPKSAADNAALEKVKGGLWKLRDVAPTVMWVDRAQVATDRKDALGRLLGATPGTAAVVEARSLTAAQRARAEQGDVARATVAGRVVAYERNRIAVEIDAPDDGIVIVHESYFPHWEAHVDGRAAAIVPANVQFRGVFVDAGKHRIEMEYRPPGYRALALLSPLALLAAIGLILWERRQQQSQS